MTFPTPSGGNIGPPLTIPDWKNQATDQQTFNDTVQAITQQYGDSAGTQFGTWYQQAWAADPTLTPNTAVGVYFTGHSISSGVAGATGTETGILNDAPSALTSTTPAKAANSAQNLVHNLTSWTEALGKILGNILSPHFWIRGGEIVLGLFLIIWGAALFMRKDVTQLAQSIPLGKTV